MLFETATDDIEHFAVTELFCEKRGLPYNQGAADNAAMTEKEVANILKNQNYDSVEQVQDAMMNLLAEKYKLELMKITN